MIPGEGRPEAGDIMELVAQKERFVRETEARIREMHREYNRVMA